MTKPASRCCSGRSEEIAVPDVCSLSPSELGERLAAVRADFAPHVRAALALPDGRAWEFDPRHRNGLERLVALERECCSGLEWSVCDAPDGSGVRLEVRGPGANALADLDRALAP